MSFRRYGSYRDSTSELIGHLPSHWQVRPLGTLGRFSASGIDKLTVEGQPETRMVNYTDVFGNASGELRDGSGLMVTTASREKVREYTLADGDLLITPSSETAEDIGHAAVFRGSAGPAVFSYHLIRYQPSAELISDYAKWALNSSPLRLQLTRKARGTTRQILGRIDFTSTRIPLPPLSEQVSIAAFLDRETAKIDGLVEEQRRLIELLKEKRQAVISHAVTKGLDSSAPMKDSSVEPLGDVPAHWLVTRLKRVVPAVTVGIVVEPSKYYVEAGVPALRSLNVRPGRLSPEDLVFISEEANTLHSKSKLRAGDIVAVRTGQPGTAAIIPPEFDGTNCIDLIIIRKGEEVCERFLCWFLASNAARQQFAEGSGGAIQLHFNVAAAKELALAVPPLDEQRRIAAELEQHVGKLDALVAEAQRAIELLRERRAALISAAVTGKIDVREPAAAPAALEPA